MFCPSMVISPFSLREKPGCLSSLERNWAADFRQVGGRGSMYSDQSAGFSVMVVSSEGGS